MTKDKRSGSRLAQGELAGRVHGGAADGTGEHRFQSYDEPTTMPAVIPFSRAPVQTPRITIFLERPGSKSGNGVFTNPQTMKHIAIVAATGAIITVVAMNHTKAASASDSSTAIRPFTVPKCLRPR